MKTQEKKPYVNPQSTFSVVELESSICTGSSFGSNEEDRQISTGISEESHTVNHSFTDANNFSDASKYDWD